MKQMVKIRVFPNKHQLQDKYLLAGGAEFEIKTLFFSSAGQYVIYMKSSNTFSA